MAAPAAATGAIVVTPEMIDEQMVRAHACAQSNNGQLIEILDDPTFKAVCTNIAAKGNYVLSLVNWPTRANSEAKPSLCVTHGRPSPEGKGKGRTGWQILQMRTLAPCNMNFAARTGKIQVEQGKLRINGLHAQLPKPFLIGFMEAVVARTNLSDDMPECKGFTVARNQLLNQQVMTKCEFMTTSKVGRDGNVVGYTGTAEMMIRICARDCTNSALGKASKGKGVTKGSKLLMIVPKVIRSDMLCSHGTERYWNKNASDIAPAADFAIGCTLTLGDGQSLINYGADFIKEYLRQKYGDNSAAVGPILLKIAQNQDLDKAEKQLMGRFNARIAPRSRPGGVDARNCTPRAWVPRAWVPRLATKRCDPYFEQQTWDPGE
jgi:hypothetical protein